MLGAILGDIAGSRFEFDRGGKTKEFTLFTNKCEFTDDTVMSIAVADALTQSGPNADEKTIKDNLIKSMQAWGRSYPNAGYGARFIHWIFTDNPKPYYSFGNGSAMRVSSVGWLYNTLERTIEVARYTAEVSHNHPEGIKGAECTAAVIFLSRIGKGKNYIKHYVEANYQYDLSETVDQLRKRHQHIETCMDSLPKALVSFFEGNSFEDVVRNAVSLGGDTDTIAAIAGSMAEAYYGISEEYKEQTKSYLDQKTNNFLVSYEELMNRLEMEEKDHECNRNVWIEMICEKFAKNHDMTLYEEAMNEILERIIDKGTAITPCVDVEKAFEEMDVSTIKKGDVITLTRGLRLHVDTMENSKGEKYLPLFTSSKELDKGETANIRIHWSIKALILDAYYREEITGLVINPFSSAVILPKEVLKIIIEALERNKA